MVLSKQETYRGDRTMKRLQRTYTVIVICSLISFFAAAGCFAQVEEKDIPRINSVTEFTGTWEEIGKQQAYYFPEMTIQVGLLIQALMGVSGDDAVAYYEDIKTTIPEGVQQQMQGLAQGLTEYWSVSPDDAWSIVLISTFAADVSRQKNEEAADDQECMAFAFASEDGVFLSHNNDQPPTPLDLWAQTHFKPTNGDNAFLSVGVPSGAVPVGMVINEKGLGLTFNVGRPNKTPMAGVPIMLFCREVVTKCDTLDEAVTYFTDVLDNGGTFSYSCGNIAIVDFNNGSMARLQVMSNDIRVTYGQELKDGVTYIACTNHFDDDFSPFSPEELEQEKILSSFERYDRLMELLPQYSTYNLETCWDILGDYKAYGEPGYNTLCRNSSKSVTSFANVFTADKTYYTIGPACVYLPLYGEPQVLDNKQPVVPCITGRVTAFGQPLARAKVSLAGLTDDGIDLATRTGPDGSYAFNNIISGVYLLTVQQFLHLPNFAFVHYDGETAAEADIRLLF